MSEIWFWQQMITPHMAVLASQVASKRSGGVTYVAAQPMSGDRLEQGWSIPATQNVRLKMVPDADSVAAAVAAAPADSIHICQGIRGNGYVRQAQLLLRARGLRQWVVMETVDDAGLLGVVKRLEYRRLYSKWRNDLRGIFAIGQRTPDWVVSRGWPKSRVYPFAYFLEESDVGNLNEKTVNTRFRFLFVGQFVERKKLDLLISALSDIKAQNFELVVVGSGPREAALKAMSKSLLPGRVEWVGRLPLDQVPEEMVKADCIVLPSRHDGWGAVISEALMVGTPVICSDTCGASGVVRASGQGGVFRSGERRDLVQHLERILASGMVNNSDRMALARWARCLGAEAGAAYLLDILEYKSSGDVPVPPWDLKPCVRAGDA